MGVRSQNVGHMLWMLTSFELSSLSSSPVLVLVSPALSLVSPQLQEPPRAAGTVGWASGPRPVSIAPGFQAEGLCKHNTSLNNMTFSLSSGLYKGVKHRMLQWISWKLMKYPYMSYLTPKAIQTTFSWFYLSNSITYFCIFLFIYWCFF